METRPSMSLISLGTPTTVAITFLSLVAPTLSLPYSKATINMQGCWQRPVLVRVRLLVCLHLPGACAGTQPQRDVHRLHCLPYHSHQIVTQSIEVRLVAKRGRERFERLRSVVLVAEEAAVYERLGAPSQWVEQSGDHERRGHYRKGGLFAREGDEEPL